MHKKLFFFVSVLSFLTLNPVLTHAQSKKKKQPAPKLTPKEELVKTADKEERQAEIEEVAAFAKMGKQAIPQFYWQAENGQVLVSPYIEASYFKNEGTLVSGTPGGVQYSLSGQGYRLGLEAEYGMFSSMSLGARLAYEVMVTNEDVSTRNGIDDIILYTKGHYGFLKGSFHYGLRLGISPGQRTEDGQGNNNSFSGGFSATPYLGFARRFATGYAGIDVSYEYKGDRTTDRSYVGTLQTVKSTQSGGHVMSVNLFYEKAARTWSFGSYVGFMSEGSKEFKDPNKTNPTPEDGESNFMLGVYTPILYGNIAVTPRFEYRNFLDDQLGNRLLDVKWTAVGRVDFRFPF